MYFLYPDNELRTPFNPRTAVPYDKQKATDNWMRHFDNSLYLTFILKNDPDRNERAQAQKELAVCERKMDHWKRHPNWDTLEAGRKAEESRKLWQGKRYNGAKT